MTGGTGGHVLPAVNFGNYLISKNYNCDIVTDYRGYRYTYSFNGKIYKIQASHLSGGLFFKLFAILKLIIGFIQSFFLILIIRPKKIISFGSYASIPPSFCLIIIKYIFKIEFYIHEQNSVIGRSNRMFISFTNKFFVNFNKNYQIKNKYQKKIQVVGLPNNKNKIEKKIVKKDYQKEKFNILIYGGSQGSLALINFLQNFVEKINIKNLNKIQFIIQCPKIYEPILLSKLKYKKCNFLIDDFFYNIEELLLKADLIISRAGAGTINDIIRFNIPSILIPLHFAKDNHQHKNALILADLGCAIILEEKKHDLSKVKNYIEELLMDYSKQKEIIDNFKKIKLLNANKLMLDSIVNEKKS